MSRNLGKQVADIYQAKAVKHLTDGADEFEETIKRTIEEYKAVGRRSELQSVIKKMECVKVNPGEFAEIEDSHTATDVNTH